jgi:hypothetical protein
MKPRPPDKRRPRRTPARDVTPPEVPEASKSSPAEPQAKDAELPDHIRRMLEAAYT